MPDEDKTFSGSLVLDLRMHKLYLDFTVNVLQVQMWSI